MKGSETKVSKSNQTMSTLLKKSVSIFPLEVMEVQSEQCSEKAFKKEMSCPLCDTVLAKDGIGELVLRPDDKHIKKTATKLYGLDPDKLCEVLQLGLEFWLKQKQNQSLQHVQELKRLSTRLEEVESKAQKLSKALSDERLMKKSLQNDKEALERHVSELETRYAEKARSMRKLSELYSELRQVHRRLESDLRGVRNTSGYEEPLEQVTPKTIEVRTRDRVREEEAVEVEHEAERNDEPEVVVEGSERMSFQIGRDFEDRRKSQASAAKSTADGSKSIPMEELFTFPPVNQARPFMLNRRHSRDAGRMRRRRQHSGLRTEDRRRSGGEESGYLGRSARKGDH